MALPSLAPAPFFTGLTAEQRQDFKESFRRVSAEQAGANEQQLQALHALEKGFNNHFPVYGPCQDGSIRATYLAEETVAATVRPDGLIQVSS